MSGPGDIDLSDVEDYVEEDPTGVDGLDMDYRKRGRPRLPPDQRRREKLTLSLTGLELRDLSLAAASSPNPNGKGGPTRLQDWARRVLIEAAAGVLNEADKTGL